MTSVVGLYGLTTYTFFMTPETLYVARAAFPKIAIFVRYVNGIHA